MPMYGWKCAACDHEVDVLRSFDGFEDPPTGEEVPAKCDSVQAHKWVRVISSPRFTRGANWRGSKGHW